MTLWNKCVKMAFQLDEIKPGWAEKINLESLDLNSCFHCVIGQAFPEEDIHAIQSPSFASKHWQHDALGWGMDREDVRSRYTYYRKLNKYWKTLIEQRQEQSKLNQYASH